ncbi:MAG: hypothetical protein ABR899_11585, partial [Candidatus Krumholzibacteriaceae bacterium]
NIALNSIDAIVMSHCRTVELAVERFAALNDGVYPSDVDCNATPDGQTVVALLPGGSRLLNPMVWCYMEPHDGAACCSGQIGYQPVCQYGINAGYVITGVGIEAGTTIMCIVKEPPTLSTR